MKEQDNKKHSDDIQEICNLIYTIKGSDYSPSIEETEIMLLALSCHHGVSLEGFEHMCEHMIENFKEMKG